MTKNLENPIYKGMLDLLATSLNGKKCETLDLTLWPDIRTELKNHSVFSLIGTGVANSTLSTDDKMDIAVNVRTFHELMIAQKAVIELLNSNNIQVVVLKGAAASQYYTKPEFRQYGDIDLLVLPEDYRRAFDLLCSSGYQNIQQFDATYDRHIGFKTPDGQEVELHRYFSSSFNDDQNEIFDKWLYANIKNAVYADVKGYSVPVLPALENGLVILGHINQHLGSGLGLRQIIDWMLYVRKELTDEFWKNEFQSRAESIGMDYLAKTATKMCQKYLGLSSDFTWCNDVEDELVDDLMLYIIGKGNFGRKVEIESRGVISVSHQFTNPVKAFKYLTKAGCVHMEKAGLKPRKSYAWLYQIGHLLLKAVNFKNKNNLAKGVMLGSQDRKLLKRLRVTRI